MHFRIFLLFAAFCGPVSIAQERLGAATKLPSKILDLALWKLTLPVAAEGSKHAREISQPELAGFADASFFHAAPDGGGVIFRARADGATTKGSRYPRAELREMRDRKSEASWATDDGLIHRMEVTVAVLRLPDTKPQVVCAQIHDAKDDLLMVRLEGRRLFVERNKTGDVILLEDYKLGDRVRLKIEAGAGNVRVWCNDRLAMTWVVSATGCYFKMGCYTQSNPSKGDRGDSAGVVLVSEARVTHTER